MQTLLLYLLIMALVVAVVFAVVWFVFGRGEDLPPLEPGTTLTRLPHNDITGDDIRSLRFLQTLRGYKQSEVDWALARLAHEVDDLRATVAELNRSHQQGAQAAQVDDAAPENSPGLAWDQGKTTPPEP